MFSIGIGYTMTAVKSWLARLSFSFLILAGLLGWNAWREYPGTTLRMILEIIGASCAFVLFLIGTRFRHAG